MNTVIAGIGTDIVEVDRVASKLEKGDDFLKHVFSEEEIAYCSRQKVPAIHYAARWAVKEAYLKAAGVDFIGNHKLSCICTKNEVNGKPFIALSGREADLFKERQYKHIHVSISHTTQYAVAYVVIESER
ncbi:MAG: holo-ACP synthase [Chitinophagaceae bacterium]